MIYSGIYKITNTSNQKVYIGSSVDIERRWKDHFYLLKGNRHRNIHLQSAFNKYGETSFHFEIIELVEDPNEIQNREQEWIDLYFDDGKTCYNISKNATNPMLNNKHTEETKKRLSDMMKGRYVGELNFMFGKVHSQETRDKISKSRVGKCTGEANSNSKLTQSDVDTIRHLYNTINISQVELAKQFNVTKVQICDIVNNKKWHDPSYTRSRQA